MKKVLITGGTSGIGLATVERLLSDGYEVWVIGRSPDKLVSSGFYSPENCKFVSFDLSKIDNYSSLVSDLPKFDGIVFSAGIVANNPLKFMSVEKHMQLTDINQNSPILLLAALSRSNKLSPSGAIVFLSSISGAVIGMKGIATYAATKAALIGAMKVIALELAPKGIRVNCVAPGMVNTELVRNATYLSDENKKADMANYPLGNRYAEPHEIAGVISFLIGPDSSFVTGQTIVVDGGFTLN
jgi:NAD(P)-dependent dehydrogenase (short-subunit alcohol dehydrogenase family)